MTSPVYFGSAHQAHLDAKETLPAKLNLILDRLQLRDRVKGETVALKMHTGNNLSYSTIHPLFIRQVVKTIHEGGGKVFVVDVDWDIEGSEARGYTAEVLGCPVLPSAGVDEKYFYAIDRPYKNIQTWKMAGMLHDASFLVNFAHIKGHPSCSYGGAIKNLALGCMVGETRSAIHDSNHFDRYWYGDLCPDAQVRKQIIDSCPFSAIVEDKNSPGNLHIHFEPCNQCMRCQKVAPPGSLLIQPVNFHSFQEACAVSASISLGTFAAGKSVHLSLATHMTPVCDCFGFTGLPILPDAGIFGSNDIVALEQAVLDVTGTTALLEQNVPTAMEVHTRTGHPFAWLHGPMKDPYVAVRYAEQLGLGSTNYELVDVLPVEASRSSEAFYISAN